MSSMGGTLGAIAGGVGGFMLGGPAGAAMGASLGSSIAGGAPNSSSGNYNTDMYNLELAKWNRYNQIYAPIQDSLANYYKNLTQDELIAKDLTSHAQAFNTNRDYINKTLAQRNLTGTGIDLGMNTANQLQLARENAQSVVDAPQKLANARSAFIGAGIVPQGTPGAYANTAQQTQNQNVANVGTLAGMATPLFQNTGSGSPINNWLWSTFGS